MNSTPSSASAGASIARLDHWNRSRSNRGPKPAATAKLNSSADLAEHFASFFRLWSVPLERSVILYCGRADRQVPPLPGAAELGLAKRRGRPAGPQRVVDT